MAEFLGEVATGEIYIENGRLVMRATKLCVTCKQPFLSTRRGRRGRWVARCDACLRPPDLTCAQCGSSFERTGRRGPPPRFCSESCRRKHDAKRPRRSTKRPTPIRRCKVCGAEFEARKGGGRYKYCGDVCRDKERGRINAADREARAANTHGCCVCGDPVRINRQYCAKKECQAVRQRLKYAVWVSKPEVKERLAALRRERAAEDRATRPPKAPRPAPTPEELERRRQRSNERSREYRERHPDRTKQIGKRYRDANPEKLREIRRKVRAKKIADNTKRINAAKGDTCQKCGVKKPHRLLHYHHVDPATKFKNVSQMKAMSWKRIEEEIAKCVVWCVNCHATYHSDEERRAKGQLQLDGTGG